MITSSNKNIFRVTGPLCGEFTGPGEFPTQRPVTRSFYVFFDLRLNKRLSKQPWGWWFETPSWSLWLQCNDVRNTPSSFISLAPCFKRHVFHSCILTHWDRDKMADIFQPTFSNTFLWTQIYEFRLKFQWNLFPRVQFTISQHWFR